MSTEERVDMPDPLIVGSALLKAAGKEAKSDGLIRRVLGPSADVLGAALARWTDARVRNVGRILEDAHRKLGDRAELPGSVSMRVGGRILEEGSYCDDSLVVEYLGGVLASSRSGVARDDRGARWVSLVTSMSVYEIRLHYLLYDALRRAIQASGANVDWGNEDTHAEAQVLINWRDLVPAMDFEGDEEPHAQDLVSEAMFALHREGLTGNWLLASANAFATREGVVSAPEGALRFIPSTVGIQLFMWAHGLSDLWRRWTDSTVEFPSIGCPSTPGQLFTQLPRASA